VCHVPGHGPVTVTVAAAPAGAPSTVTRAAAATAVNFKLNVSHKGPSMTPSRVTPGRALAAGEDS
jgi:hypothetical protein